MNLPTPLAVLRHDFRGGESSTTPSTSRTAGRQEPSSDAASEDEECADALVNSSRTAPDAAATPAAKRVKLDPLINTSSPETFGKLSEREAKGLPPPKTPLAKLQRQQKGADVVESSSPLPPSPATPLSVTELKQGRHEIIGLSACFSLTLVAIGLWLNIAISSEKDCL